MIEANQTDEVQSDQSIQHGHDENGHPAQA